MFWDYLSNFLKTIENGFKLEVVMDIKTFKSHEKWMEILLLPNIDEKETFKNFCDESWTSWGLKWSGRGLLIAGTGVLAVKTAPFVISFIGFKSTGVAASSWAASLQGPVIYKGSYFAALQSAGALGKIGLTSKVILASTGAAIADTTRFLAQNCPKWLIWNDKNVMLEEIRAYSKNDIEFVRMLVLKKSFDGSLTVKPVDLIIPKTIV